MRVSPTRPDSAAAAFTLVELIVSLAVLVLLTGMVASLLNNATAVATQSANHLDADSQARFIFDRMSQDFARIIKRSDIDYYYRKNPGNDEIAFYSEMSGYFPQGVQGNVAKSNVSLIGYRVRNHQLERLGKSLVWNGVKAGITPGVSSLAPTDLPMVFLPRTIQNTWPNVTNGADDPDYQVICEQIFRFEFCFQVKNETVAAKLSDQPWLPPRASVDGLRDVSAIVVALGVLDSRSREILSTVTLDDISSRLGDVNGATVNDPPIRTWQNGLTSMGSAVPKAAASQIRIYQRFFYLDSIH